MQENTRKYIKEIMTFKSGLFTFSDKLLVSIIVSIFIIATIMNVSASAATCNVKYGGISENITEYKLCRDYTVGYDADLKSPLWVAYNVTQGTLIKLVRRHGSFSSDHELNRRDRVYSSWYIHTGYDRGHMAPAINFRYSKIAEKRAFIMSNIVPQLPSVNRGIWKALEYRIQKTVLHNGQSLVIIDGPIYSKPLKMIKNKLPVPSAFYKIVICKYPFKAAAFIIPNVKPPKKYNLASYTVSIDDIELVTGIDFLTETPILTQSKIEGMIASAADWPLIIK